MNDRFLLKNINLCLGDDLLPQAGLSILVEGGRICKIGPETEIETRCESVLDGEGAYLLPGLIDCHNHLSLDCELMDYLQRMNNSETELAIIAIKTLERDLKSGVTTSRCMGDRFMIDVFCKNAIQSGFILGPKLQVCGMGLRSRHGHGFVAMPFDGDDLLVAIRENLKNNVDWIKFYSTGIAMQNGYIQSFYSQKEMALIIEEAHRAGKPVTSHCIGGEALITSVALGIDCIEHAYYAGEEEINAMLKSGTPVCLTPSEYFTDKLTVPAASQKLFKANRMIVQKSMENIIGSGLTFVLGTDGMHGKLWQEACWAAKFGAQPVRILQALTRNAARLLGIDRDTGSIKEGLKADMLLIDGNPLEDIEALSRVKQVFQDGIAVMQSF